MGGETQSTWADIIRAATQSPAALAVLVILVVAAITVTFIKGTPWPVQLGVFVALVVGLVSYVCYVYLHPIPAPLTAENYPTNKETINNALISAAQSGDIVAANQDLTLGADINYTDENGQTALHHAAVRDDANFVTLLMQHAELDPNIKDNNGATPLHLAALFFNSDIVKLLSASKKLDPTIVDKLSRTPLVVWSDSVVDNYEGDIRNNDALYMNVFAGCSRSFRETDTIDTLKGLLAVHGTNTDVVQTFEAANDGAALDYLKDYLQKATSNPDNTKYPPSRVASVKSAIDILSSKGQLAVAVK